MCYRHANVDFILECPECGEQNEPSRFFCRACGAELPDYDECCEGEDCGCDPCEPDGSDAADVNAASA